MIYEFMDCALDDEACELQRAGSLVPLQPKVLDVLIYLLKHRDRVVPKNELLDNVWANTAVGDGVLTRAINLLRGAVGDAGNNQAVVRTLPRKGYRFSAEVVVRDGSGSAHRPTALLEADEAYETHNWQDTLDALARAELESPLSPSDLEARAWSLLWEAEFSEATGAFEQAHSAYEASADVRGAARMALQLSRDAYQRKQTAPATGWLARAKALLEDIEECEEVALFEWTMGRTFSGMGDSDKAQAHAERAIEIARRVGG